MRRLLAALVVVLAFAGCAEFNASLTSGGADEVTVDATGRISFRGTVVNTGDGKAYDVVLHFTFTRAGAPYFQSDMLLGDVSAGTSKSFSGAFVGPPVDPALFGWSYTITWD